VAVEKLENVIVHWPFAGMLEFVAVTEGSVPGATFALMPEQPFAFVNEVPGMLRSPSGSVSDQLIPFTMKGFRFRTTMVKVVAWPTLMTAGLNDLLIVNGRVIT
jgi:hypothetical protein